MNSRHEIADAIFRRKTFILVSSLLLMLAVAAAWRFSGGRYESQMILLVRNNRADVVLVPGQAPGQMRQPSLMEGQIATEVQLLLSRSSLREVVTRCKLVEGDAAAVEKAITALGRDLKVTPMPKASIIEVRYGHKDANKAAEVLRELLAVYTDQHLRVHKGGGTDFFERQAEEQGARLRKAQERLSARVTSSTSWASVPAKSCTRRWCRPTTPIAPLNSKTVT